MNIVAFYGSMRRHGNSEILADLMLQDLKARKIYLQDRQVLPIHDLETRETDNQDEYPLLVRDQLEADCLVFASPIYWYGLSGMLKTYIDRWSQSLRDPELPNFREKMKRMKVYLILVGGDRPAIKALPIIQQMVYICEFLEMEFKGYVIGQGDDKGEVLTDDAAFQQAQILNERLKNSDH